MEVYILDSLYRPTAVVDRFESLIWTERFKAVGDFELTLQSTLGNRNLFTAGTRISINESYRIMTVETIEDVNDAEGHSRLTIKGRSLEAILDSRLAMEDLTDLTSDPKWIITDAPADIARKLFHDICVTGVIDAGDIIAGVNESSIFPADTIPEPPDDVTYSIDPTTLYVALKNLCDVYDMGFRLVRHPTTFELHFDIYMGSDRTTQQTTLPAVVFSPQLQNLTNTTELSSTALYKNVAYVISPAGHEIVYASDVDSSIAGFARQALVVVANDIESGDPDASDKMIQRGKEELAKNRRFIAFDGELNQNNRYRYGTDYNLGDLTEFQNESGAVSSMQVTEQIFVSDREGDRSYPTLTMFSFIVPGSWDSWTPDETWDMVDPGLVWDDA